MKKWKNMQLGILAAGLLLSGCGQAVQANDPTGEPADVIYTADASLTAFALDAEQAAEPAEDEEEPESPEDAESAGPQEEPEEKPAEPVRADWYTIPVFAHAMGTVDGRAATNSLDAFMEGYEAGQRVFEVDLQLTSDGHLIARHDWDQNSYYNSEQVFADVMDWETFMNTPICFFYSPVDIEGLVELMQTYPDVYFVTDSKDTDEETVRAQTREIARAIREAGDPSLWEQVIVQIYHEDMYAWVSEEAPVTNWIFTLYQIVTPDYDEIGAFCQEHGIPVVTINTERLKKEYVEILHSYDRLIYIHTVNRLRAVLELSWGADGYYSDYITPAQAEAVLAGTNQMYLRPPQEADAPDQSDSQDGETAGPEQGAPKGPSAEETDK